MCVLRCRNAYSFVTLSLTGEILLSLILFGKDVSTGPRLQRWIPEDRREDRSTWSVDDTVSPTSSMDMSDYSTDLTSQHLDNDSYHSGKV